MSQKFDLLLKNATAVTPSGVEQIDIGVSAGTITAMGDLATVGAAEVKDMAGLHVLPGVIDSQVHFREPGNEHKEDLHSGTKAAILGGVTCIFDMPNTNPTTTTIEAFEDKVSRVPGRAWCDVGFFVGGTPDPDKDWQKLESLPGCPGIKIFMGSSTGNLLVSEDEAIEQILRHSKKRVVVHSEDEARLVERKHIAEEGAHPRFHPIWRDEETAIRSTTRLLNLLEKTNRTAHVLHITTAQEMALLAKHKRRVTVEVLPQHLTLTDEDYDRIGSLAQMNPPIRSREHQEGLWQAVQNGVVDILGSDHAPHTREEKAKPYPQSPAGLPGVQTLVPIMLNHINDGKLSLERFVDLVCHGPQRVFGLIGKGRLAVGYEANFTIVDMKRTHVIDDSEMASKCGWTPYHGKKVTGWPVQTILRGKTVMQDGQVLEAPAGRMVSFL